ncbi:uncharacterized protein MONOS_7839 [Monocercomonoides exilis]|uniref:uncharacterized protein n=1 Tax=Monocercomonoides exilis TaxID=2049356 RepID=UPI003559787F|nr:hypothetical protein MONOS_7839 [Monocercomonoides exilis]|eukprot:MONOS_7839.1-p1 / transcript=MONOS_7839.1 / gene=MONOS_7839 / organism=Monocercomonoides_exilis_PA203 / gene_product=unspecified product / transcript_product=unspecified product / location=Mono_scaffold00279:5063-6084(-) / protein_length=320 / sequence_SO=supercontig / SO=protein_coding / is_pseudo=false
MLTLLNPISQVVLQLMEEFLMLAGHNQILFIHSQITEWKVVQYLAGVELCISNSGGDSAGSLTFNDPPVNKPNQFFVNDCQIINNKLISTSTSWGGAALCCSATYSWMRGNKFITFCFFDGNTATNGRGNDLFFNGNAITQSPFQQCGSTTPTNRVWIYGTADSEIYNGWLPLITTYKIIASNGTDGDVCGVTHLRPCATIEYALECLTDDQDNSLTLLASTFTPLKTLIFRAPNIMITGNDATATIIASSGIPQPSNSHLQSQSTSSLSSSSLFCSQPLHFILFLDRKMVTTTTNSLELTRATPLFTEVAILLHAQLT